LIRISPKKIWIRVSSGSSHEFEKWGKRPSQGFSYAEVIMQLILAYNLGNSTIGNRSDFERVSPIEIFKAFNKKFTADNAHSNDTGKFDESKTFFWPVDKKVWLKFKTNPNKGLYQKSLHRMGKADISIVLATCRSLRHVQPSWFHEDCRHIHNRKRH